MIATMTMGRVAAHNERPATVWSSGGAAYEQISRGIADALEHCVLRLDPRPGERVLDVATGTGWTSRLIARRGADVVGVDIASDLVEAARASAANTGLPIRYEVGDAEQLPFEDGAFDAVTSTFGVMFASRPEAAAAELARVCRPGGRVALTVWDAASQVFGMFKVMRAYMPAPPTPAPPSPFDWGRRERLVDLLSGSFDLAFEQAVSYYREPSAEAAWETFVTGYGPTRMLAEALSPDRRDALRADFVAFHRQFQTELGIEVPRTYWLAVGRRR